MTEVVCHFYSLWITFAICTQVRHFLWMYITSTATALLQEWKFCLSISIQLKLRNCLLILYSNKKKFNQGFFFIHLDFCLYTISLTSTLYSQDFQPKTRTSLQVFYQAVSWSNNMVSEKKPKSILMPPQGKTLLLYTVIRSRRDLVSASSKHVYNIFNKRWWRTINNLGSRI